MMEFRKSFTKMRLTNVFFFATRMGLLMSKKALQVGFPESWLEIRRVICWDLVTGISWLFYGGSSPFFYPEKV